MNILELEKQFKIPKPQSLNMDNMQVIFDNSLMVLTLEYLPETILIDKYGIAIKIPINIMFTD